MAKGILTTGQATAEKVEQMNAYPNKLFFIGAQLESGELVDFMEDLCQNEEDFKRIFPGGTSFIDEDYNIDKEDMNLYLYEKGKLGYIAECHHPKCRDFTFNEKGRPSAWSSSAGHCRIFYAYGETMGELIKEIGKIGDQMFEASWKKELDEKSKKK